jgi:polyhydroxyalkanoate synthesis regulator phasin
MPQNDLLKRFLDAGVSFTNMSRSRAEAIIGDLVKAGEVQANQTQKAVDQLVARSRTNAERLVETVRKEVGQQVANLRLASQADIARLERRIDALAKQSRPAAKRTSKSAASKTGATKSTAKKAATSA